MCGYSYALTCLMTHWFTGSRPGWMRDHNLDNLSLSTFETILMTKLALGCDDVYPANPNFVFSTNDSTIFVFEGVSSGDGGEDWSWKIIDMSNGSSGIRSDFKVRDDGRMAGGL